MTSNGIGIDARIAITTNFCLFSILFTDIAFNYTVQVGSCCYNSNKHANSFASKYLTSIFASWATADGFSPTMEYNIPRTRYRFPYVWAASSRKKHRSIIMKIWRCSIVVWTCQAIVSANTVLPVLNTLAAMKFPSHEFSLSLASFGLSSLIAIKHRHIRHCCCCCCWVLNVRCVCYTIHTVHFAIVASPSCFSLNNKLIANDILLCALVWDTHKLTREFRQQTMKRHIFHWLLTSIVCRIFSSSVRPFAHFQFLLIRRKQKM